MSSYMTLKYETLYSLLVQEKFLTPEETEKKRVDALIISHRDEVIEILKGKYPEDFI